ncbi:MAG: hypothetical protein ACM3QS_11965 [Bacteroidota bacterium]
MFLESVIEVIIGLVFIWLVLSTATIQIQEWIAARLRWRAVELEGAIRKMLNDEKLTRLFYDHPIIRGLSGQDAGRNSKPSYIPAKQFSTVLISVIMAAGSESALLIRELYGLREAVGRINPRARRRQAGEDLERIFELARLSPGAEGGNPVDNLILATLEKEIADLGERYAELADAIQGLRQSAEREREKVEQLSKSLPNLEETSARTRSVLTGTLALGVINPGLRLALNSLLIGIDARNMGDQEVVERLQSNIETWFNDSMDRLSGWYKRKAQLVAFSIGVVAALLLNIDTVHVANQLWREPALRDVINANADRILEQYGSGEGQSGNDPISAIQFLQDHYLGLPVGWNFEAVALLPGESCSFAPAVGAVFGFAWRGECRRPVGAEASANGWVWLLTKLLGILMTGIASAQGSSFWFDLLMKIVNVRSAGIKPA